MSARLQLRGDTLANWLKYDPVLMEREVALIASNPDKPKVYDLKKVGDGTSKFSELPMLGYEFPKFVVSFKKKSSDTLNGETSLLTCYSHIRENVYIGFGFALCQNTSETTYYNMWRLQYIHIYSYTEGKFIKGYSLAHTSENEFAFKQTGKGDFTGGWHGDERIDIDNSCYAIFIADGVPIRESAFNSDFELKCSSFCFRQMSTLHETVGSDNIPISGHPIIAKHLKDEFIEGGRIVIRNKLLFTSDINVETYFTGLFCLGKNVATSVCIEDNGVVIMSKSNTNILATDGRSRTIRAWNDSTNLGALLTSRFIRCRGGDEPDRMTVWDRTSDSKYYGYTNIKSVSKGDIIETEMDIKYFV